jgi:hypothetical protein
MLEQAEAIVAAQDIQIYTCLCATSPLFSSGAGWSGRDAYIGHIEVEQVEQQPFLKQEPRFWADSRAPLKWSKWSR